MILKWVNSVTTSNLKNRFDKSFRMKCLEIQLTQFIETIIGKSMKSKQKSFINKHQEKQFQKYQNSNFDTCNLMRNWKSNYSSRLVFIACSSAVIYQNHHYNLKNDLTRSTLRGLRFADVSSKLTLVIGVQFKKVIEKNGTKVC